MKQSYRMNMSPQMQTAFSLDQVLSVLETCNFFRKTIPTPDYLWRFLTDVNGDLRNKSTTSSLAHRYVAALIIYGCAQPLFKFPDMEDIENLEGNFLKFIGNEPYNLDRPFDVLYAVDENANIHDVTHLTGTRRIIEEGTSFFQMTTMQQSRILDAQRNIAAMLGGSQSINQTWHIIYDGLTNGCVPLFCKRVNNQPHLDRLAQLREFGTIYRKIPCILAEQLTSD